MVKVAIVKNIPAPYSLDLFNAMRNNAENIGLSVVYSAWSRKNRTWTIDETKISNSYSLNSFIIQKRSGEYIRYIHIPRGTWKTLNKIDPDVLLVYEYSIASVFSFLWAKWNRRKFVHVTEVTLLSEKDIGKIQRILRKIIIKYADLYIACSSKAKEKLIVWGASADNIRTILLTSDIRRYLRKDTNKIEKSIKKLLYVGSIEKRKGIDLVIHALKYTNENVVLTLVGAGDEEYIKEITELAKSERVLDKIKFAGFLEGDELINEYHQSDAFVFPTRSDCYGLVLVEAYCSGLPIISSQYADGVYDIVENGVNGLIVDPYDSKSFGDAIEKVLADTSYCINASKMKTDKFEIQFEAQEFLKVIFEAVGV